MINLALEGISCAGCVKRIEAAMNQVPGVSHATVNFAQRTAIVEGSASAENVILAIKAVGYNGRVIIDQKKAMEESEMVDLTHYKDSIRRSIIALSVGAPLMLYGMLGGKMEITTNDERLAWLIIGILTALVMRLAGRHFYINAWRSFCNRNANMDTLIALGTGSAWIYSMIVVCLPRLLPEAAQHLYFEATAMIIGLINLGLALETRARSKTSSAIKRLIGLQPKTARVVLNEIETDIPVDQVNLDNVIRVRPGEKIPVDGVVTNGQTNIDEAMISGEPMPVKKSIGDEVIAGTINKTGSILFKATRIGDGTRLAQIIELVRHAQNSKPSIGRLADTIAGIFVPCVIIFAIISALVWLNFGPSPSIAFALVSATTVLIIACPCALGLATPMSIIVGIGKAAEAGILIRNGEAIQTASQITTLILDKTGTITEGKPRVTAVETLTHTTDPSALNFEDERKSLLLIAAALEQGSEHPLAQAIVESASRDSTSKPELESGLKSALKLKPSQNPISLPKVDRFQSITGLGISGIVEGKHCFFGNEKLMRENNIKIELLIPKAQLMAAKAQTPIYLAADGIALGIIAVADPIKADSITAINRLKAIGIHPIMLTGDNRDTAKVVAEKVGISDFVAEVLPEDKAKKVAALQSKGKIVGMTGDGINDAPALALADVGFAMGTGTDVAIESADITLIRGSLHGIADALAISKATLHNIKQNLFAAFIYNVLGIPIAAGIFYPLSGLLLNPVIAGAAMAFSSVTVVSNANRLRFFKPGAH